MAILGNTKITNLTLLDGVIGDLNPVNTDVYNLGTSSLRWNNLYAKAIYGTTQAQTDNSTAMATTAYVRAAIAALDSTLPSGSAASKTLTALTITDGKMTAATFSNIAITESQVSWTNGTLFPIGDDVYIGDVNQAGSLGIKSKQAGNTSLAFIKQATANDTSISAPSGTTIGKITWDGTQFTIPGTATVPLKTVVEQARWLANKGGTTVTIADSSWAHGQTGRGGTNRATVWNQKWTQSGLTYTPSGGTATTLTDSGDWVIWLSQDSAANNLWANMALDGYYYSLSGYRGGGFVVSQSEITQNIAAGANSQLLKLSNTRPAANIAANQWFWGTDFLVANTVANTNMCHVFGKANSTKNSGVLNYHHAGDGSDSNYVGIGLYGTEDALQVYANKTVKLSSAYSTANAALMTVTSSAAGTSGNFYWGYSHLMPSLATGGNLSGLSVGTAASDNNSAYFGWHHEGSNNAGNYLSIGIYAHNHLIKVYKNGDTVIAGTTTSTKFIGPLNGNADTATAANLTTTTNAIAYYTNTAGKFGSKASANGALYATSANGSLSWGTLPVAQGGTGATSFTANSVIISGSSTTSALTTRAITNNTSATAVTASTNIITANTLYYHKGNSNIVTVGTISSGTWQGTTIGVGYGGTGKTSWTQWGIIYASASTTLAQVTAGSSSNVGQPLISGGAAAPTWNGGLVLSGTSASSWIAAFKGTTDAANTSVAAVTIAGGLAIAKKLYAGSEFYIGTSSVGKIYSGADYTLSGSATVVTNDNLSTYFTVNSTDATYPWSYDTTNTCWANMGTTQGIHNINNVIMAEWKATSQFALIVEAAVNAEHNYDYFEILVNDAQKFTTKGGSGTGVYNVNGVVYLKSNDIVKFRFKKDSSTEATGEYFRAILKHQSYSSVAAVQVERNLLPTTTNTQSLGSQAYRWSKVYIGTDNSYGNATTPIYWDNGVPKAGTIYAGGTAVTLNNASKAGATASFYAPTTGGTANTQALVGNGATSAPKWVNITPSITITAGTSTAAPSVNVTVLGQSGTAQSITTASTSKYGVTKLTSGYTSTDSTLAATGASILAAIQGLDVTAITGTAAQTITSISETDGKISATYSNIAIAGTQITSGTIDTARLSTDVVKVYNRNSIGTSPNYDTIDKNGLFELRASSEVTGEAGTRPFAGYGPFLTFKYSNVMLQLAGNTSNGWYIRGIQSANVTLAGTAWSRLVTNSGTWSINITGSSHSVLDSGDSSTTTFAYSKAGLNYADYTWLAAWNGRELRAVNKSQFASAAQLGNYLPLAGGTMTGALNFANGTQNKVGDDVYIGDQNVAGHLVVGGLNGSSGIRLAAYSSNTATRITADQTNGLTICSDSADTWIYIGGSTATGMKGIYFPGYTGGWYMSDTEWLRSHNNKSVYLGTGRMRTDLISGGGWIAGSHDAAYQVYAATPAAAGNYYQGWYMGKTPSGAWSWGVLAGYNDCYFVYGTDANYNAGTNTTANIRFGSDGKVYNAAWNDYAEYRYSEENTPGKVIVPQFGKPSRYSIERLEAGARIISDTYGMAIGETDKAKTPVGLAGRVLAYPYREISAYHIGDCVCSAPNGTVDIMTREEIQQWPDRIIGTVDEIPDYEVWDGTLTLPDGGKTGHKINVNGRIWIDIR